LNHRFEEEYSTSFRLLCTHLLANRFFCLRLNEFGTFCLFGSTVCC
jgi:hypothetical protein